MTKRAEERGEEYILVHGDGGSFFVAKCIVRIFFHLFARYSFASFPCVSEARAPLCVCQYFSCVKSFVGKRRLHTPKWVSLP